MIDTKLQFNGDNARSCFDRAQHERVCSSQLSTPFVLSVAAEAAKSKGKRRCPYCPL